MILIFMQKTKQKNLHFNGRQEFSDISTFERFLLYGGKEFQVSK